jgi:hypothetical protein
VILVPFAFIQDNTNAFAINSMKTVSNNNICYLDIDFTFIQELHFVSLGLTALACVLNIGNNKFAMTEPTEMLPF